MRIREGCILTATNSSDERVKSLIGCKGALHVVNGEPLRFVVGTNENARSFTTATTKRLGVIGVNIFVSTRSRPRFCRTSSGNGMGADGKR